jgi:hypothetical protein
MGGMMQQAGFGGGLAGAATARPTKRNPVVTLLISWGCLVGAQIVGSVLAGIIGVYAIASLFNLVGYLAFAFIIFRLVSELKNFTNNPEFAPWMAFVPCLNIWFFFMKVPEEMAKAKQMAGIQNPTKPAWMYLVVTPFAMAADLNDLAGP